MLEILLPGFYILLVAVQADHIMLQNRRSHIPGKGSACDAILKGRVFSCRGVGGGAARCKARSQENVVPARSMEIYCQGLPLTLISVHMQSGDGRYLQCGAQILLMSGTQPGENEHMELKLVRLVGYVRNSARPQSHFTLLPCPMSLALVSTEPIWVRVHEKTP